MAEFRVKPNKYTKGLVNKNLGAGESSGSASSTAGGMTAGAIFAYILLLLLLIIFFAILLGFAIANYTKSKDISNVVTPCPNTTLEVNVRRMTIGNNGTLGTTTVLRFGRLPGDTVKHGTQRMFITEQDGRIFYTDPGYPSGGALTLLLDLTPFTSVLNEFYSEFGVVGFELHPNFTNNGRFFVYYTADALNASSSNLCLSYAQMRGSDGLNLIYDPTMYTAVLLLEEWNKPDNTASTAVFVKRWLTLKQAYDRDTGIDNLRFDPVSGGLLVVIGDGGCFYDPFNFAQNTAFLTGKILRVEVDPAASSTVANNCTSEVATFTELFLACPDTRQLVTIYASGVRNGGYISVDTFNGISNYYFAQVGQSFYESVYRIKPGDNFGWFIREALECTCIFGDPTKDGLCGNYSQTIPDCVANGIAMNASFHNGDFLKPIAITSHQIDRTTAIVGGYVYRGDTLGCQFEGNYIFGDWSQHDTTTNSGPAIPTTFSGVFTLWMIRPSIDGTQVANPYSKGRIQVNPSGLVGEKNYLTSIGYDIDQNRMFIATSGLVAPYSEPAVPSTLGRIYELVN
jgi:hypothetical protein